MAKKMILRKNANTDDILQVADKGKIDEETRESIYICLAE